MQFTTKVAISAFALTLSGLPALAGDAENGATIFQRQCANCHNITDDAGEVLAGRPNMRTGPNLYQVVGRQAGVIEGFRYGKSLVAVGAEKEVIWSEEAITAYLEDPTTYLRETLGDKKARSQMAFKLNKEEDRADVAAYLATFSPVEAEDAAEAPAG